MLSRVRRIQYDIWSRAVLIIGVFVCSLGFGFEFDRSVPSDMRRLVESDLRLLGSFSGDSATRLHRMAFGDTINGQVYVKFITDVVKRVSYKEDLGELGVLAVSPNYPNTLWLGPGYSKRPIMKRISGLIHEARHLQNMSWWKHIKCPNDKRFGALAGKEDCDIAAFGGYGIQIIFLFNIRHHCVSCSKDLRQQAGSASVGLLERIRPRESRFLLMADS